MYVCGQTLNTMTLGGFALAVGILVDNATVVIENIERHVGLGEKIDAGDHRRRRGNRLPTLLSTLSICIVFVPVFLLRARPSTCSRRCRCRWCISLLASLVLSFTLVPVLFKYLMRLGRTPRQRCTLHGRAPASQPTAAGCQPVQLRSIAASSRASSAFAKSIATRLPGLVEPVAATVLFFVVLMAGLAACCSRGWAWISFPQVDAGQMRLHVRAPAGHADRRHAAVFRPGRGGHPRDRRQRPDRRAARQYRPALQRHQHRAQRLRHRRPDGRRDPDLAEGKAHADAGSMSPICGANCRSGFPSCSSSSSRPTSSTRC